MLAFRLLATPGMGATGAILLISVNFCFRVLCVNLAPRNKSVAVNQRRIVMEYFKILFYYQDCIFSKNTSMTSIVLEGSLLAVPEFDEYC